MIKYFRFRTFAKIALGAVALGALGTVAYLQLPLFGAMAGGERLERMKKSSNFVDGVFQNPIDTPMMTMELSEMPAMLTGFLRSGQLGPTQAIPATKTDLKALNAADDLVIWLGHSSFYVQMGGQRILLDPVFSDSASPVPGTNRAFAGSSIYAAEDMPAIDLLLITHDHYDHLDYPSILALKSKVKKVITGLGVGAHFERWGYDSQVLHEVDWHDAIEASATLQIRATPGRHFSGRGLTRNKSLWVGFVLRTPERRIYFSGDSGYGPHFSEIGQKYGPFDWVTVDSGQYDPRWANVHMTPEQAAQAAEDVGARAFTPGHIGRFTLAAHTWDDPFRRGVAASEGRGYMLWTPQIGQPIYLDARAQTFEPWWESLN